MYSSKETWTLAVVALLVLLSSAYAASPVVDSITVTPDDSPSAGVQVSPVAGTVKTVTVSAEITDADGTSDIVSVNLAGPKGMLAMSKVGDIDSDTANYSISFDMEFYDAPVEYPVEVTAEDSSSQGVDSSTFEYQSMIALDLDSPAIAFPNMLPSQTSTVVGDSDEGTIDMPTVKNAGNQIMDVAISGTNLSSGTDAIEVSNFTYTFEGTNWSSPFAGVLGYTPQNENISLYYGASYVKELSLKLDIPEAVVPGSYLGSLTVAGVTGTGNKAPVLHFIKDKEESEGNIVTITADAVDLDNDTLTYLINDTRFNQTGNVFTWQTLSGDEGTHNVRVTVSDGSLTDYQDVEITITEETNNPPSIDWFTPSNTTLKVRRTYTVNFDHSSSDSDNDTLTYSWRLDGVEQATSKSWNYSITSCGTPTVTLWVFDEEMENDSVSWSLTARPKGDANWDGSVNIIDLSMVGMAFGSKPGDSNWNSAADISPIGIPEGDGSVNILDLSMAGQNFGNSC